MVLNPIVSVETLALAGAGGLLVAGWAAWRSGARCSPGRRSLILVARLLGLVGLLALAGNPGYWRQTVEETQGEWALLLDRSASMATPDDGVSRWDRALKLAAAALGPPGRAPQAALYAFADDVAPTTPEALAALAPEGTASDITGACGDLLSRYRAMGRPLTGILLLSDGRQVPANGVGALGALARARETPIYTLAVGGKVPRRDLAVRLTRTRAVAFAGQECRLPAVVSGVGLGALRTTVELRDAQGRAVATQPVELAADGHAPVVFTFTPRHQGYAEYEAVVPVWPDEKDARNNTSRAAVVILEQRMRILTVEGVPHWDSKFLMQLLHRQPNVDVTSLYRLATDRIFRIDGEATGSVSGEAVDFPETEAALRAYDLIVFGKGVEYFLTPRRVELLRHFLRDQGGGVLFARGKPYAREFPELAALEPLVWGELTGGAARLMPAPAGVEAGLFGEMLPAADEDVWRRLPPLRDLRRAVELSPFTLVLAEAGMVGAGEAGGAPAAALPMVLARRYGKGLVVTINAGDSWKWDFFPDAPEARTMYAAFWSQLAQWMVTYAEFLPGEAASLRLTPEVILPGTPVRARIQQRVDAGFVAAPRLRATGSGGETVLEVTVGRPAGTQGHWEAMFTLDHPDAYRVVALDPETGKPLTHAAALRVDRPPSEMDEPDADPQFLSELAEASGGRLITEADLPATVEALRPESRIVALGKAVWQPLWNRWWVLALVAACFTLEWWARRRSGLS